MHSSLFHKFLKIFHFHIFTNMTYSILQWEQHCKTIKYIQGIYLNKLSDKHQVFPYKKNKYKWFSYIKNQEKRTRILKKKNHIKFIILWAVTWGDFFLLIIFFSISYSSNAPHLLFKIKKYFNCYFKMRYINLNNML